MACPRHVIIPEMRSWRAPRGSGVYVSVGVDGGRVGVIVGGMRVAVGVIGVGVHVGAGVGMNVGEPGTAVGRGARSPWRMALWLPWGERPWAESVRVLPLE